MDVDRAVREQKLGKLALEWADQAEKEIWDKIGPALGALEKCSFYAVACAEMAARMYDALMKDDRLEGAELPPDVPVTFELRQAIAQDVLQRAFTAMAALIRGKGHEVQVSAKLAFTKVSNFRAREGPPDPEACPHDTCSCELDQDGRCAECMASARVLFSGLLEGLKVMKTVDLSGRRFCRPCAKRNMDQVLAKIVREEFTGLDPSASEAFMNMLIMTSQNIASMEMPLTKRAWDEVQRGPGA